MDNYMNEHKHFSYEVMSGTDSSEVIQLLSLVMESYKNLSDQDRDAVAHWFFRTYFSRISTPIQPSSEDRMK